MSRRLDLNWLTARPIAHRGLHERAQGIVENTASAFAAAMAGIYAIECDLQLTADSEAVVFHDEQLERLTLGSGNVKDQTAAQMKALTIRDSSDRVQTLGEMLDQVKGRVPLVIELKSHWDGDGKLVERTVEVLSNYTGKFALMSFDPDMTATIRKLAPGLARGIVADRAFDDFYDRLPAVKRLELRSLSHLGHTKPDFVSYYFHDLPYAPVTGLRQTGMPVISWTIRSPQQAAKALRHTDQITFEGYRP